MRHSALISLLLAVMMIVGCSNNPSTAQPTAAKTPPDAKQLSRALQPVNETYARLVMDKMTEIKVVSASFLTHYQILQVEYFSPSKPVLFYVGYAPDQEIFILTGMPDNFISMARADGVKLDVAESAAAYGAAYLETTRSMSELIYQVGSAGEVKFRPNLSEEEEQVKAAFLSKYGPVIVPPRAEAAGDQYQVTIYEVHNQTLKMHVLQVSQDGALQDVVTILEKDLPLVVGL